jgi:hypothetical protein
LANFYPQKAYPMKRFAPIVTASALLLSSLSFADVPAFSSKGLIFDVYEFGAETDMVFYTPGAKKPTAGQNYSVKMEGSVRVKDKTLDVVGFTKKIKAVRAKGAGGTSILKSAKASGDSTWKGGYSGMHSMGAEVELKDVELGANAYTLEEMVVIGQAVIARQRVSKLFDGIVTEDKTRIISGVNLRLSAMKISDKRDVELEIQYDRPAGLSGPILEAVYAVDAQGNELGGGRWDKSPDIFASSIRFKYKFPMGSRAKIDQLKLVFVTVFDIKPYAFTISDVFQR